MLTLRNTLKAALITSAFSFASATFAADIDMNANVNDVAIYGYDPVSYFVSNKPMQGSNQFTATYKNAIYQFSTEENRDKFRSNPARYAPQYGGYCAFGVTMEKKFDTDPNAWTIVDGKLYLNLNKQVLSKWSTDIPGYLKTANMNWPEIKNTRVDEL